MYVNKKPIKKDETHKRYFIQYYRMSIYIYILYICIYNKVYFNRNQNRIKYRYPG